MIQTAQKPPLRLAYYADDFTGATDALEQLESAGVPTVLFLEAPSARALADYPGAEAIGVAGRSRSLPTEELADEVGPALEKLRDLGAPHVHYKVCSTFDSSPAIGSIGRVIDVAAGLFDGPFIPLVVGAPHLGRWCVFGNLFAGVGIGAETEAYRLDRHPSMSRHPVTPADEADLRVQLSRQTSRSIGLIDVRLLDGPEQGAAERLANGVAKQTAEVLLFDCLTAEHLKRIGAAINPLGSPTRPLFSVGSSAIESALTSVWPQRRKRPSPAAPSEGRLLVLSGSCSPVSLEQIHVAEQAGLTVATLQPDRLAEATWESYVDEVITAAIRASARTPGLVVTTHKTSVASAGSRLDAARLGKAFGRVYRACRQQLPIGLTVVMGGDTSSYTARALGIESLTMTAPLTAGAPLCEVRSADPLVDGAAFVFKGGQVGRPDLFVSLTSRSNLPVTL
ncbi:hypothetical protein Pla108_18360 [Botrimarina colliarenosi]|uniref:Four-carbon acid sugar kinase family protein n=1 Tax=Botrimarina colliarenosi TaxID=2528001 RepID=A0A5C6ACE5_9BACT|nr:four-carbon acid sugar kinase family protein [Botrimarina colliarenosi]TWT97684.1 hypothetical protein Pla108_18360 [Botrimarina colliarenosi]